MSGGGTAAHGQVCLLIGVKVGKMYGIAIDRRICVRWDVDG
jgi:hypothetical protein